MCPQKCGQPQGATRQALLIVPRAGGHWALPSGWSKSVITQPGRCERVRSRCVFTVVLCMPPCGRQDEDQLYPGRSLSQMVPGRVPLRSCRPAGTPPSDPWPRTQRCAVGTVAVHVPATCGLPARCLPCMSQSPGCPAPWSWLWNGAITGAQTPLRVVPIPVGDVMPRRRGRAPSEALASWPWHPSLAWGSQPDGGREVLRQPRGRGRRPSLAPGHRYGGAVRSTPSTGAPHPMTSEPVPPWALRVLC